MMMIFYIISLLSDENSSFDTLIVKAFLEERILVRVQKVSISRILVSSLLPMSKSKRTLGNFRITRRLRLIRNTFDVYKFRC